MPDNIDFVARRDDGRVDTVECKVQADGFSPRAAKAFRRRVPAGSNLVVTSGGGRPYRMRRGGIEFVVGGVAMLDPSAPPPAR